MHKSSIHSWPISTYFLMFVIIGLLFFIVAQTYNLRLITFLSVQRTIVNDRHMLSSRLLKFILCRSETLCPSNSNSPCPLPPAPGKHQGSFLLSASMSLAYFRFLMWVKSYSIRFFRVWFISLRLMSSRFIHVVALFIFIFWFLQSCLLIISCRAIFQIQQLFSQALPSPLPEMLFSQDQGVLTPHSSQVFVLCAYVTSLMSPPLTTLFNTLPCDQVSTRWISDNQIWSGTSPPQRPLKFSFPSRFNKH